MIVAFDNTFLTLALNPDATPRPDPSTGHPAPHCRQRIEALIDQISRVNGTVVVPAPSWAETLCSSLDAQRLLAAIEGYQALEIAPFGERAAYELAEMTRGAIEAGDKRSGVTETWQHVKIDRQIVAVAKACGANTLYTDDGNQAAFAKMSGLDVVHTWQLELPPEYAQTDWVRDGEES